MMSKPCLEAPLFVTPIFIYIEAGVFFWVGGVHEYLRNQLVFWSSQKKND